MEQTSIDFSSRARRDDPQTSKDAARSVQPFGHQHHALIVATLERIGPATSYEIGRATGLTFVQVGKRTAELRDKLKLIEPLTENVPGWGMDDQKPVTRKGDTGRQCTVWKLV